MLARRAIAVALVLPATLAATGPAYAETNNVVTTARPQTHHVTVGSNPYAVAVAGNLGKAYVVNDGSVSVLSLLSRRRLAEFGTGGFHGQNSITLANGNLRGYITNNMRSLLTVIDTERDKVVKNIEVGYGAVDTASTTTKHGPRVFVTLARPAAPQGTKTVNQVVTVSARRGTVVRRTRLPAPAYTIAATPDGHRVWAGSITSGRIWVLDSSTGMIVRRIRVNASGPVSGIAFTRSGSRAWVAGIGGLSIVNTRTGRTTRTRTTNGIFPRGANLGSVALTADGKQALIENSAWAGPGSICALSTRTIRTRWCVRTGRQPEGFAVDQRRRVAYVPDYADDQVTWFRFS